MKNMIAGINKKIKECEGRLQESIQNLENARMNDEQEKYNWELELEFNKDELNFWKNKKIENEK